MKSFQFHCGKCRAQLDVPLTQPGFQLACPHCRTPIAGETFPALFQEVRKGDAGQAVLVADESSCFYHPAKKAVIACESCGRFLCSLCDVDFGGRHLCPHCIETGAAKNQLEPLRTDSTHHDEIALLIAFAPLFIFYFTLITAPIAIYYVFRHWNTPLSAAPRSRWRFALALVFATAQLTGWALFFVVAFM